MSVLERVLDLGGARREETPRDRGRRASTALLAPL